MMAAWQADIWIAYLETLSLKEKQDLQAALDRRSGKFDTEYVHSLSPKRLTALHSALAAIGAFKGNFQ